MRAPTKRLLLGGAAAAVACAIALGAWGWWSLRRMEDAAYWADAIAAFEAADLERPFAPGGIVFTGSSSIRFWDSLAADMAPLPVLNRGFGGSHLSHVVHYVDPLVLRHRPSAVVVYAGDNDLSGRSGKTPEGVARDFDAFVAAVHAELPETRIYFLAIKPSTLRWSRWPAMRAANEAIAARCAADPRLVYLDVATPMLGPDGQPRGEFFRLDGLHLNEAGYALWTGIVAPRLRADGQAP